MKSPRLLLSALTAVLFSSCAVSPLPPAEKQTAMKQLEGDWYFVSSDPMTNVMGQFIPECSARRLTVLPGGKMILSVDDSAIQNRLAVIKTSDSGFEMRLSQRFADSRTMIYDRSTNTVSILIKVVSKDKLTGGKKVSYSPFSFARAAAPQ